MNKVTWIEMRVNLVSMVGAIAEGQADNDDEKAGDHKKYGKHVYFSKNQYEQHFVYSHPRMSGRICSYDDNDRKHN